MSAFTKVISEMLNESHQGRSSVARMQGGMIAKVVDNVDPEGRYRIRISYPWLADAQLSPGATDSGVQSFWARLCSSMGGADFGAIWLPEIDDEVMVVFEDGDFAHPVIVGTLWNGSKKSPRAVKSSQGEDPVPNKEQGGSNDLRFMRSRQGHTLTFIDKNGSGGVSLRSNKSAEVYIGDVDGGEGVFIYDMNHDQYIAIDTVAKSITINSGTGDVNIIAKEFINMKCKNMKVEVEEKMDVEVGEQIHVHTQCMLVETDSKTEVQGGCDILLEADKIEMNP